MKKTMILALALITLLGFATVTLAEETKAVTPAVPMPPVKAEVKMPAKKAAKAATNATVKPRAIKKAKKTAAACAADQTCASGAPVAAK